MGLFSRSRTPVDQAIETASKIQVVAHKNATKNQIEEVKRANDQLNGVLARNGFTIKIYLAAGGSHSAKVE